LRARKYEVHETHESLKSQPFRQKSLICRNLETGAGQQGRSALGGYHQTVNKKWSGLEFSNLSFISHSSEVQLESREELLLAELVG
jgi:hypothetical protein